VNQKRVYLKIIENKEVSLINEIGWKNHIQRAITIVNTPEKNMSELESLIQ
jgi:hypothetical protein